MCILRDAIVMSYHVLWEDACVPPRSIRKRYFPLENSVSAPKSGNARSRGGKQNKTRLVKVRHSRQGLRFGHIDLASAHAGICQAAVCV